MLLLALLLVQAPYVPPAGSWATRTPAEVGLSAVALDSARAYMLREESRAPRDLRAAQQQAYGKEPHAEIIGPMADRGDPSAIVIRHGYVVATWGPVERADMTNSITKSFLSAVAGLAWRDGRIPDVHQPTRLLMPREVDLFEAPHNQPITWDHLLRQTSDWQGTLWGKPDWADRPEGPKERWAGRPLRAPGTHYKYNDVRVNVLALALLHVLREPLPVVLRRELMDPIGASSTWRWTGYDSAWVVLDGQRMQSVSGGGHWGGGMFINDWDLARFGLLMLRDGMWGERRILPSAWLAMARAPGSANPDYGHMNWFLNTGRRLMPSAPADAVAFLGNGLNVVYMDRTNDLVVVLRWINGNTALDRIIGRILQGVVSRES